MAMLTGAAMMCLTISSCSNDDNAVDIDGDVPNVGVATVKNFTELTTAEFGWVIATDGKAYLNSAAATAAGTQAVAFIFLHFFLCISRIYLIFAHIISLIYL